MSMTGDEIIALSKKHTIFEWVAQNTAAPIAIARAKGCISGPPKASASSTSTAS